MVSPTVLPGAGRRRTAVVLLLTMPMAASSAMMAEMVSAGVSPGTAIMSSPTEQTHVIASSLSSRRTPTCAAAVKATRKKKVGLIATAASVRSGAYERTLGGMDRAIQVYAKACPLFVPLVENGRFRPGDAVIETVAREYLTPLKETGIDTLMLGCTHYPLLMEIIGEIMGPEVTLINAGAEAARALRGELEARDMLAQRPQGETTLYASDSPADFAALAGQFLCRPIGKDAVGLVDIERY